MKTKHTPEPWKVGDAGPNARAIDVWSSAGQWLATMKLPHDENHTTRAPREEALANAFIMAAAPALYRVLNALVSNVDEYGDSGTDAFVNAAELLAQLGEV
jgi:hypothetical protein